MRDSEETDMLWESRTSPGKQKRKKDSKNGTKCKKCKNNTVKTDENIQKTKKKKNKFKEAVVGRKAKKKEKKKKKNVALGQDDSFIFTQATNKQPKTAGQPETLSTLSNDKVKPDHLTQDSKKKTKRGKKVVFDLSPGYICVKRPKSVTSSPQGPKHSILLEHEAVRHTESCSQVTVTGHSRWPTHADDSQCTSEDINSQDLFITQKIFRASPPEASSGEASDKATPQMFKQEDKLEITQHLEGAYTCPQDAHFHHHHRKTNEHKKKSKVILLEEQEEEEEEGVNKVHHKHKKGKLSFHTQIGLNANLTEETKVLCPLNINSSGVNPEPVDVNPSLDVEKSKEQSWTQQFVISTSTQTENFFTTELSSYLQFHQKSRVTARSEDLKPLDLSLPQRARQDLMTEGANHKDSIWHSSCSPGMKDGEIKEEPSLGQPCSVSTGVKGETTPTQSESADTTTSSEDNEPSCCTGKLDLTQVRAVQMRLNESFFFKTKGEGQSPRPESPLMKLAQGRDVKRRKRH